MQIQQEERIAELIEENHQLVMLLIHQGQTGDEFFIPNESIHCSPRKLVKVIVTPLPQALRFRKSH
jgi:hypothetical protein